MSFEAYDTRGVVDAPSRRIPNRAMVQGAEGDVRGTPARDAGAFERWDVEKANERARSPSNSDRRRVERGAAEELRRTDSRAGSALGSATRRAIVGATETALLPYHGARALSGGRLPELSAEEAYAQAESLARDEPVAATRERQAVQDRAHPDARGVGDMAGRMANPFFAAEAMKGGLRLRALGGRASLEKGKGLLSDERGAVTVDPSTRQRWDAQIESNPKAFFGRDPQRDGLTGLDRERLLDMREQAGIMGDDDTYNAITRELRRRTGSPAHQSGAVTARPVMQTASLRSFSDDSNPRRLKSVLGDDFEPTEENILALAGNPEKNTGLVGRTQIETSSPNKATANVALYNAEGRNVAHIARTYRRARDGTLSVSHDFFKFQDEALKGQGAGKKILRDQVESYDKLGVASIDTDAHWDGRYVWPTMGFDLQNPKQFAAIKRAWQRWVREEGFDPGDFDPQNITELARWKPVDAPISSVKDSKGAAIPVSGKAFLLRPDQDNLRLRVDLNGESGNRMREYLGLPPRAPAARSPKPQSTLDTEGLTQMANSALRSGDVYTSQVVRRALAGNAQAKREALDLYREWRESAGGL